MTQKQAFLAELHQELMQNQNYKEAYEYAKSRKWQGYNLRKLSKLIEGLADYGFKHNDPHALGQAFGLRERFFLVDPNGQTTPDA